MASRARNAVSDVESRKKLFRATAGLTLQQQLHMATQLQTNGNDVLEKIQQMKKSSKQQKQMTKENNLKYEWLHEHHHLAKLVDICAKDLESTLLRIYNDATAEQPGGLNRTPSTVLKTKRSPRPETPEDSSAPTAKRNPESLCASRYAKELEELIQMDQDYKVALLKHIASEREQRSAMKQIVIEIRKRKSQGSSDSAMAIVERMKREAQNLVFDAVIGHQMVEATLEDECKECERDFQASYESLLQALRVGKGEESSQNNQNEDTEDSTVETLCRECPDEMLQIEIQEEFGRLPSDLRDDLASFERDFHLLASQEDAAGSLEAARSKCGGWPTDEDEKFMAVQKNYERRAGVNKKIDMLYDQVRAVLPHRDRLDIKRHAKYHTHLRFYQEKCKNRQADYERKYNELQLKYRDKITALRQQQDERARVMQQFQILQQQCAHLHNRVAEWKMTKEAQQRIKEQQEELEKLLRQQQQEEEDAKWKKKNEELRQQVDEYKKLKLLGSIADEVVAEKQRRQLEEEKEALGLLNAERVQFRMAEYERKLAEDRAAQARREQLEIERLAKLEAIKQETPYAERLASIVVSAVRVVDEKNKTNEHLLYWKHDCRLILSEQDKKQRHFVPMSTLSTTVCLFMRKGCFRRMATTVTHSSRTHASSWALHCVMLGCIQQSTLARPSRTSKSATLGRIATLSPLPHSFGKETRLFFQICKDSFATCHFGRESMQFLLVLGSQGEYHLGL